MGAAEAFTANRGEDWKFYPGSLKNQGDWALATGINRFLYHTFAHKPNEGRPGMVMGPYGVHWDRGQTWWPMAEAYHRYIARCQHLLQQGRTVADVLYLLPEGAPNIFQPPASAFEGSPRLPDRRGYNFDGCSPQTLLKLADVREGRIVFPSAAAYRLLVLPNFATMTPELLDKLESLVRAGATVIGAPPRKTPSLVNYPACDREVARNKVFDLPLPQKPDPGSRTYLDLGEVQVQARVRVNGRDCGVVWTAPWRVDISDVLKATGNQLEIEVANLWPNRMIGDAERPDAAYTQTTYRPYKAGHPLLSSGLLGPLKLGRLPISRLQFQK